MGDLNTIITTISDPLEKMAFDGIRAYLTLNAPWTNTIIIKQIVDTLLNSILNILFTKTDYAVYVLGVISIVNTQNEDFKNAIASGDQTQIINAARNFIKLNNV
jgi:hypothetical protein